MKTAKLVIAALAMGALTTSLVAAEKRKAIAGPKGGRILESTSPLAEFVVEKDRTVSVNFYDASLKPVAVTAQTATVVAEAKGGQEKIEFEKKGDALASKSRLPPGDGYNVVVQFKSAADAKPQNFRFLLDMGTCGGCKRPEYACICDE